MRVVVQRVSQARVDVDGASVGEIGRGLLLLVGVHATDTDVERDWLVNKVAQLRIFADDAGKMNRSVVDIEGDALVVSQFTLYGNSRKGNRPSFVDAAPPEFADRMYLSFAQSLSERLGRPVPTGVFGADMQVSLINDGPVTLWLEREAVRENG